MDASGCVDNEKRGVGVRAVRHFLYLEAALYTSH